MTALALVDAASVERERGAEHLALAAAARTLASGAESEGLAVAGGGAVYAWPDSPFNLALGIGWSDEPPEPALATLEAFYRKHGAPCVIDLADQAPPAWRSLLFARGYRLQEALYLWALPLSDTQGRAGDPRVARALDDAAREACARAVAGGFLDGAAASERDLDVARAIARTAGTELFVARDAAGDPVAGGALRVNGGVAHLFSASTVPRARRQGLQTALIEARLAWARALGARVAIVQTEPTGPSRHNVERLGFRVAYTNWALVSPEA